VEPKLLTHPPVIENGEFVLPTGAGWGTDVNEDELRGARRDGVKPHDHRLAYSRPFTARARQRRFWRGQCPATIDNVLRLHDEIGLDISVISNSGHYLKEYSREEALPAIHEANQYLAALRDQHKGRSSRSRSRFRVAATRICASSSAR